LIVQIGSLQIVANFRRFELIGRSLDSFAFFAAAAPEQPSAPPTIPPGYELIEEIGHGGLGAVYRARDATLDRDVAIKVLSDRFPADSPAAQRFLSEARITGSPAPRRKTSRACRPAPTDGP
jgi:hypothetical protein